ncbi:MAG TPA: hypothetical protein ENH40_05280 [Nitrospirae bacterium]|nr:hypothetical protein [Nitrospirota bacterium]
MGIMRREEARDIIVNIDVVRHYAEGGAVQYLVPGYNGKPDYWRDSDKLLLGMIGRYRIKPEMEDLIMRQSCPRGCCEG